MKFVQKFCAATILTLLLTFSASAGDILLPGARDTAPPPQSSVTSDAYTPEVPEDADDLVISDLTELDPITGITLSLLQSLLSLF
jgi:hypothetical protein